MQNKRGQLRLYNNEQLTFGYMNAHSSQVDTAASNKLNFTFVQWKNHWP